MELSVASWTVPYSVLYHHPKHPPCVKNWEKPLPSPVMLTAMYTRAWNFVLMSQVQPNSCSRGKSGKKQEIEIHSSMALALSRACTILIRVSAALLTAASSLPLIPSRISGLLPRIPSLRLMMPSSVKIFEEVYESDYKEKFAELRYRVFYTLIDDAVARVIRSKGGFIWACKNYDGDVMSDMLSTAFGSLAMMTSYWFLLTASMSMRQLTVPWPVTTIATWRVKIHLPTLWLPSLHGAVRWESVANWMASRNFRTLATSWRLHVSIHWTMVSLPRIS